MKWYTSKGKAGRKHSKVQSIEPSCFGTYENPSFNFHGAETNGLLDFVVDLLAGFPAVVDHGLWVQAGRHLVRLKQLIYMYPQRPPPAAIQV